MHKGYIQEVWLRKYFEKAIENRHITMVSQVVYNKIETLKQVALSSTFISMKKNLAMRHHFNI